MAGFQCRYSDAARVEHGPASQVSIEFGEIAQTYYQATDINHSSPRFNIFTEYGETIGMEVDKIGYKTGWTFGYLINDCVDLSPAPGILLECQSVADYYSEHGDSGASVFYWDGTSDVGLVGLHWGKNGAGTHSYYSSMVNLHWDFGAFASF